MARVHDAALGGNAPQPAEAVRCHRAGDPGLPGVGVRVAGVRALLLGAGYLVLIDTLARTLTAGEIPLGVLTAMIGAPAFFVLLRRNQQRVWDGA